MTGFLIDTNVLSELVRPKPEPKVVAFIRSQPDLWLSVIILHEFAYGIERLSDPNRRAKLDAWVQGIKLQFDGRMIETDALIAEQSGKLRASVEKQGRNSDPIDALIAASALAHGLTVVTRNTKDFELFGVGVVNPWEE
jgi:toxin FitB